MIALYDDVPRLSISDLKRLKLLVDDSICSSHLTTRHGRRKSTFQIVVDTIGLYVRFKYSYGGQAREYMVGLDRRVSNLGFGTVWYFRCPRTGKLCRKLYLIGGFFLHRQAFSGYMYKKQAQGKRDRNFLQFFDICLADPPARTHYKGVLTKRYRRYLARAERVDVEKWLRL